ncbi:Hypothetical predicted protein [Scomber scombrus]|uniref:Uncharacterized protein n=1 Tax=Scomber scombrus TaxID=13677 RepID=A0AAV1N1X0_SCOSC
MPRQRIRVLEMDVIKRAEEQTGLARWSSLSLPSMIGNWMAGYCRLQMRDIYTDVSDVADTLTEN